MRALHAASDGGKRLDFACLVNMAAWLHFCTCGRTLHHQPIHAIAAWKQGKVVLRRGGMVFTFMRARGQATGSSLVEAEKVELARCVFDGSSSLC